ncbi:hypothetical protein [uncultured Cellulomonas sp.]|uniref:hypothetical protein n=1 Tax=uncultured Cellulomonas sp. TaxID=189682 RepID=UPI0026226D0F|nr:hypothetical protein [uncultured Cellulomonas sp.]
MTVEADPLGALLPVLILCTLHVLAMRVRAVVGEHEQAVVSAAGGVSVAYVFLHLLPEVAAGAGVVGESLGEVAPRVPLREIAAFVVALIGFTAFYLAERYSQDRREHGEQSQSAGSAFTVHVVAFAVYNVAIALTLPERVAADRLSAAVFTVAIAVHVLVVDRGLAEKYPHRYARRGRFLLAGALLAGWAVGAIAAPVPAVVVHVTTALVAGTVLLTVFQEELPRAGRSRVWPFLSGLAGYSAVLVALALLEPPSGGE